MEKRSSIPVHRFWSGYSFLRIEGTASTFERPRSRPLGIFYFVGALSLVFGLTIPSETCLAADPVVGTRVNTLGMPSGWNDPNAGRFGSRRGPKSGLAQKAKWIVSQAGTVPNEFGELISVAGLPKNHTYVFQNTDGDIRLVEHPGAKLGEKALIIRRAKPEKPVKPDPKAKWKDTEIGIVPARYGQLFALLGTKGRYNLVFVRTDGEISIVPYQGNQMKRSVVSIERESATPIAKPPSAKQVRQVSKDGWTETRAGSIPHEFGSLVSVSGTLTKLTFVFKNSDGDLRIVEYVGKKVATNVRLIRREEPDSHTGGNRVTRWTTQEAGTIPASFGNLAYVNGVKGNYTLVFENAEREIRMIGFQGNHVKRNARVFERPEQSFTKRRRDRGWEETPAGGIPDNFGAFRLSTGTSSQLSIIFQNDEGVISVVDMQGNRMPMVVTRIAREY